MIMRSSLSSKFLYAALAVTLHTAVAQNSTWDGGGDPDFNWNVGANWLTDTAPTPSATAALIFGGSVGLANNNNFAANSIFNTLSFAAGAGAFSLGGNAINLGDGNAGTKITNSSANIQTIGLNLALQQTTTLATGATAGAGITIGGNISGTGFGITSSGAGGLTLSGSNSYSGPTTLTTTTTVRAVANLANTSARISSALSPNSVLTLAPSATANIPVIELRANDDTTFNTAGISFTTAPTQSRSITLDVANAGSGTGKTLTLGGAWSLSTASASLATTINVTGANGYSLALGSVSLTANRYNINATANLSIASLSIVNFTTVDFNGSGASTLKGDWTRPTASRGLSINQSGVGSLTLEGVAATVAPSNLAGYTFNLSAGTLNVNNVGAMGTAALNSVRTLNISGGTIDNTSAGDITLLGDPAVFLTGNFTFGATRALNVGTGLASLGSVAGSRAITTNGASNALTLGNVTESGASMNLTKEGPGTLGLTGPAFHSGGTTVNNGTLQVNGGVVAALSGVSGTFVAVNLVNNTHFDITVGSTVGIVAGQLITGTNVAPGTVVRTVLSGTRLRLSLGTLGMGTFNDLAFSAGSATGTGTVLVGASGALGGTGTIAGATTVSGSVRPGVGGIGTLNVTNDVTWNSGTSWVFDLGAGGTILSPGPSDRLSLTGGTSDFLKGTGGPGAFGFDFAGTGTAGWYRLVTWDSTTASGFAPGDFTATNLAPDLVGTFTVTNTIGDQGIYLNLTVIPEPSTYALMVVGLGFAIWIRRRGWKNAKLAAV